MTGDPRRGRQICCSWAKINCATVFLLSVVLLHIEQAQALVNAEGIALTAFRSAIVGDPQGVFRNWNTLDSTPCNWTGVGCDSDSRVTRLFLHDAGLTGTLSGSLKDLVRLRTLSLAENSLTGSIPPELAEIRSLYKLNLSLNAFSGSIPGGLGAIGGMRMLDLSRNALSGSLPPQLFETCGRLRYISVSHNSLAGTVPSSLGNCSELVGIDFSYNSLQGSIPNDLGRLSNLLFLFLQDNFLSGRVPAALGSCTRLEYLALGANALSEGIPEELANLSNLVSLGLEENFLSGSVAGGVVFLPRLEALNISSNDFSGVVPGPDGDCGALKVLDLASNNFSGLIPTGLSRCAQLRELNLSSNQLSPPIFPALSSLTQMESLDLSFNNLTGDIPPEIGKLGGLSVLHLAGNSMSGPIPPEIGEIARLRVLDLHSLELQGEIPESLAKCSALETLDVSDNHLVGDIPVSFSDLSNLTVLNVAVNMLNGSIPPELGTWMKLQSLDLSNNSFVGPIPASLGALPQLSFLNVSFNDLSGVIPRNGVLSAFNMSSFLGNRGLCGTPLNVICSVLAPASAPGNPAIREGRGTHLLSSSSIIAISAAAFIAVGVMIVTVMNVRAIRRRRKTDVLVYESSPPSPEVSPIVGKLVLFSKSIPSRYEDWETGTKALLDRDCMVGRGTLGAVYKATFEGGLTIAVKKLETLGRIKNQDDFEHEMGLLGNLKHPNLVPLQGYYWSSAMQLLLSDFIPNGSVFHHLHQTSGDLSPLSWRCRFKIALGTAKGLAYLHHDCKPPIFHFDLKVSNILLDESLSPHVTDYGLVKLLPMLDTYVSSRKFHTTLGYVAPELACQSLQLTEKCDVYSFGMVLLELVTGRQPVESFQNSAIVLGEFVRSSLEQGNLGTCVDPRLGMVPDSEIMQTLKLGLICTSQVPARRPTMAEVVQVLESIKTSRNSSRTATP